MTYRFRMAASALLRMRSRSLPNCLSSSCGGIGSPIPYGLDQSDSAARKVCSSPSQFANAASATVLASAFPAMRAAAAMTQFSQVSSAAWARSRFLPAWAGAANARQANRTNDQRISFPLVERVAAGYSGLATGSLVAGIGVPKSVGAARASRPSVGAVSYGRARREHLRVRRFQQSGTPIVARPATRIGVQVSGRSVGDRP